MNKLNLFLLLFIATLTSVVAFSEEEVLHNISTGKDIYIKNVEFKNDINLTEVLEFSEVFPGEMKAYIKGNIIFEDCIFPNFIGFKEIENIRYNIQFEKNLIFKN